MQPADTLGNISPYMQTYFDTKTYLKENDPELFTKLATHLDDARKPEQDDVDDDNNDKISSGEQQMKDYNLFLPDDETLETQDTNI